MDFSNPKEVERWLQDKPRGVAVGIAARAALRAVPALASALGALDDSAQKIRRHIVVPVLRATAVSWFTARYPGYGPDVQICASDAASVADAAYVAYAAADAAGTATAPRASAAYAAADAAAEAARTAAADFNVILFAARTAATAARGSVDAASAISADARVIDEGAFSSDLAGLPLWLYGAPDSARNNWIRLKDSLLALNEDWEVWTEWYEARLTGRPTNEDLERSRVLRDENLWRQNPEVVNAEMRRLIDFHTLMPLTPTPNEPPPSSVPPINPVPSQGPGPRFRATEEGTVDRAPPADLDAEGNDSRTIDRLKPLALRCAADLKTRLPPNQFGELLSAVDLYVAALDPGDGKTIEWGEVWGHGVILQNAATAAERKIEERILPALEDPAKVALESLLTMHGPMILATRDGARFSEAASDFRLTREQQDALRAAAQRIAEQLAADKEVITPRAAASVAQATESIGQGPHPERGSVYGLATIKNISIVLVGGAAVATPALIGAFLGSVAIGALAGAPFSFVAVEAVKKSAAFNALVTQLGAKLDTISDEELRAWLEERRRRHAPFRRFVARNAEPLRKIAEATPELRWMLRYIDFIAEKPKQS